MPGYTKKELILSIYDEYGLDKVGRYEIQLINDKLCIALGKGGHTSVSYIADVLRQAGKPVMYSSSMEETEKQYKTAFKDVLKLKTEQQALESIKKIHLLYDQYKSMDDKKGMEYAEWTALKGWQRAQVISRNKRVSEENRTDKRQISKYFFEWYKNHDEFFQKYPFN